MPKFIMILASLLIGFASLAKPVCIDGVCYPDEAAARAAGAKLPAPVPAKPVCIDGVCYPDEAAARAAGAKLPAPAVAERRLAMGYMSSDEFIAFLQAKPSAAGQLEDHALWVVLLLVLMGGLAANLTPCVLPLVPVNLMIIGRGWKRGAAYALGITTTYGALGLAAAFGGLAFGALPASPYFNFAVAAAFIALALVTLGVLRLPAIKFGFKRKPSAGAATGGEGASSLFKPYCLGLGSATLASACVEPILIATLLLTAKWFAAGKVWAVALPFVLGAGMGLPYPFAAAGFSVLPKPGAWMIWVKRAFALVLLGMAFWYGKTGVSLLMTGTDAGSRPTETVQATTPVKGKTLIKIGAPWCRSCEAMERTVLKEPAVIKALSDFADVRKIEIENFAELARYPELQGLEIKGLPAYVIIGE